MILTEADWAFRWWVTLMRFTLIDCLVVGLQWYALYLDLPKLEVGLVAGEGLAEILLMAPPLLGDAEGEQEEPLKWDDLELFLFFFSWGDLKKRKGILKEYI